MSRQFWLDRGWYIALWVCAFIAARLWLVNPIIRCHEQQADRIVKAIERRRP